MLTRYRFLTEGSTYVVFVIYSFHKITTKKSTQNELIAHPASISVTVSHSIQNVVTIIPSSTIAYSRPHLVDI